MLSGSADGNVVDSSSLADGTTVSPAHDEGYITGMITPLSLPLADAAILVFGRVHLQAEGQ